MKCNYPGNKRNKMSAKERKEFEAEFMARLAARGLIFPLLPRLMMQTRKDRS